jgi:hypothetical protein
MPIGKRGNHSVEGADIEARIYISTFNTMTATVVASRHKPTLATLHFRFLKVKSIPMPCLPYNFVKMCYNLYGD